ncbi:MAG: Ca-activated chloride channel [Blastocatellia bacterium]|jgi:VWFA-related protein|nr:Ca-activated chloride channel [Blastocatellia bacterium]
MLYNHERLRAVGLALLLALAADCYAQRQREPSPAPTPPASQDEEQEPVKVFTEEVFIPVVAYDEHGRFDPTLELEDVLVLEDDVPQQVRSVRRVPANVLLILDMGSQVSDKRSVNLTREIATKIIAGLRPEDAVAVIQNSDRVELLEDWTTDKERIAALFKPKSKFFSSKQSRLSQCLLAAALKLKEKPAGNTHVILFTDGLETQSSAANLYAEAVKRMTATQATMHVVAFSALAREEIKKRHFGLDREMSRWYKAYGEATKQNDERLALLVREMGGRFLLPSSSDEAFAQGGEAGRDIDAQYVVTYAPKRPFSAVESGERRRISVSARRLGLQLVAMREYVAPPR